MTPEEFKKLMEWQEMTKDNPFRLSVKASMEWALLNSGKFNKTATRVPRFPDDNPEQYKGRENEFLITTMADILNAVKDFKKKNSRVAKQVGTITIYSLYAEHNVSVDVVIHPEIDRAIKSSYNPYATPPCLNIFPYTHSEKDIKEAIVHELTHVTDIKIVKDIMTPVDPKVDYDKYLNSDLEVDAFSKQMTFRLENMFKETGFLTEVVLNWLKSDSALPKCLECFQEIYNKWSLENKQKVKSRILSFVEEWKLKNNPPVENQQ
jgi:hypothetical protein